MAYAMVISLNDNKVYFYDKDNIGTITLENLMKIYDK